MTPHRRIVIAGGGTAGWITANLLAHRWPGMTIELIEAPDIATIGVGEGSTPSLKRFFEVLGIAEAEWMPRCHATYKTNIRFLGWSPEAAGAYSHPFTTQLDLHSTGAFFANCRNRRGGYDVPTAPDRFLLNAVLADAGKAPLAPPSFPFKIDYGYHFDAGLLGAFLREQAVARGVVHRPAKIVAALLHQSGDIAAVRTDRGDAVAGDLFVDCTGFAGLLLQGALGVGFRSFGDNLFNDAAVVIPTAVAPDVPPPVETRATALSSGWAWSIPLQHRVGSGYVYSRAHCSDDAAETELRAHLGLLDADVPARQLRFRTGQVERHWHRNTLAVGLAQGFVEPLEATALHLVLNTVEKFMRHYEEGGLTAARAEQFNDTIGAMVERIRDYIVAHYTLNTRHDTAYWIDNRAHDCLSLPLRRILDLWYRHGDLAAELAADPDLSHFSVESWHCLLAGYGIFPPLRTEQRDDVDFHTAEGVAAFLQGCSLNFPPHAEVLARHAAFAQGVA